MHDLPYSPPLGRDLPFILSGLKAITHYLPHFLQRQGLQRVMNSVAKVDL